MSSSGNFSFTNDSGKEVVVINAFDTTSTGKVLYDQDTLDVLTDDAGNTVIDSSSSPVKFALSKSTNNLIIAQSSNLYPVASHGEDLPLGSNDYPDYEVAAADAQNMINAENFYQIVMANPSSNLSKNYMAAVQNSTNNDTDPSAMTLSEFFASQSNEAWQKLTQDMISAVSTYYNNYPYYLSTYQSSYKFYLYGTKDNQGQENVNSGTIVMTKTSSPTPASTTDHNGGYTITFEPDSGSSETLQYSKGIISNDSQQVYLLHSFMVKGQLSGNTADSGIIPVLSGTVNGVDVIGYAIEPESAFEKWLPKTIQGWISLAVEAATILMGIEIAIKGLTWLKNKIKKGEDPSKAKEENAENNQSEVEERNNEAQNAGDDVPQVPEPDAIPAAQDNIGQNAADQMNRAQGDRQIEQMEQQDQQLDQLTDVENNPQLEDAKNELRENYENVNDALNNGSPAEIKQAVSDAQPKIENVDNTISEQNEKIGDQMNADQKEAFDNAQNAQKEAQEEQENAEETEKKIDEGDESGDGFKPEGDVAVMAE